MGVEDDVGGAAYFALAGEYGARGLVQRLWEGHGSLGEPVCATVSAALELTLGTLKVGPAG